MRINVPIHYSLLRVQKKHQYQTPDVLLAILPTIARPCHHHRGCSRFIKQKQQDCNHAQPEGKKAWFISHDEKDNRITKEGYKEEDKCNAGLH